MRRIAAVLIGAACLFGLAAPAGAETNQSSVLNVYWVTREPVTQNVYRQVTWYVGVYQDAEYGTSSDGYQEVDLCVRKGNRTRCRQESFKVGYSNLDKQGEYYTVDAVGLTSASLRGIYPLQTYDQYGNPTGDAEWTVITADVKGTGDITHSQDAYAHHEGDCYYVEITDTNSRPFEATGTENGADLGTTSLGIFSASQSRTRVRGSCGPTPSPGPGS
ncbi:MAG TPA: hypothetical protein VKA30_00150 [Actinomycetota bacterium]|nr:hypothetical protein [Actinomycetota bacterium]